MNSIAWKLFFSLHSLPTLWQNIELLFKTYLSSHITLNLLLLILYKATNAHCFQSKKGRTPRLEQQHGVEETYSVSPVGSSLNRTLKRISGNFSSTDWILIYWIQWAHINGKTYLLKDMKRIDLIQVATAARKGFRSDGTFWQKRVVLGNFWLQCPHCSCLTLQIVDAGNTAASYKAHFILVPPQWICFQCWWQFNYRTKSLENRVCFSVWMAITGVIYHVNRVSSSSSIRTEGGHRSIQCHPAVQRNPGNYQQQRVEGGKPVRWRPVAGHRGHRQHLPSQNQWQCDIASARAVVRFLVNPTIWGRFRLRGRVCGHKMEAWWPQRPNWGRPMCAMSNTCKRKTYPDWPMNNHSFAGNQNLSYS